MVWCFSTRALMATVLSKHPYVSVRLEVNTPWYRPMTYFAILCRTVSLVQGQTHDYNYFWISYTYHIEPPSRTACTLEAESRRFGIHIAQLSGRLSACLLYTYNWYFRYWARIIQEIRCASSFLAEATIPISCHGPLIRYVKLWAAHAPAMLGMFSPPPTSKETAR